MPRSTRLHRKQNATSTPERQAGVLVARRHHIGPFNFEKGRSRRNDVEGGGVVTPKEFARSDLALETELNAAILEIGKEHFLLENFDLQSLFSASLTRYYSDDVVLWVGSELTNGKKAAFQRLADVLEPVHTVLEIGVGCVDVFRVVSSFQDSQGDLISEWEAVFGGPYSTGAVIRWRTVRVWKQRVVIAERIEGLASVGQKGT